MDDNQEEIVRILIKKGEELLKQPYKKIEYTGNSEVDDLLNNIENFPHAFVLGAITSKKSLDNSLRNISRNRQF